MIEFLHWLLESWKLVICRISGDFNFNSKTNEDFYLQDGDTLFIPKKVITTSIIGEVLNPITILHREDLTLDKFVNLAGGYNQYALKRSAYVIRANGEVVKVGEYSEGVSKFIQAIQ